LCFYCYRASLVPTLKVNILKEEAERQRLQREELELELHAIKDQMQNVKNTDSDMKRSNQLFLNIQVDVNMLVRLCMVAELSLTL
jgi:Mg2+/citrate symporter